MTLFELMKSDALIVLDNVVDNISNAIAVRAKYKSGQENDK